MNQSARRPRGDSVAAPETGRRCSLKTLLAVLVLAAVWCAAVKVLGAYAGWHEHSLLAAAWLGACLLLVPGLLERRLRVRGAIEALLWFTAGAGIIAGSYAAAPRIAPRDPVEFAVLWGATIGALANTWAGSRVRGERVCADTARLLGVAAGWNAMLFATALAAAWYEMPGTLELSEVVTLFLLPLAVVGCFVAWNPWFALGTVLVAGLFLIANVWAVFPAIYLHLVWAAAVTGVWWTGKQRGHPLPLRRVARVVTLFLLVPVGIMLFGFLGGWLLD